jgi:hypothetical protein
MLLSDTPGLLTVLEHLTERREMRLQSIWDFDGTSINNRRTYPVGVNDNSVNSIRYNSVRGSTSRVLGTHPEEIHFSSHVHS